MYMPVSLCICIKFDKIALTSASTAVLGFVCDF